MNCSPANGYVPVQSYRQGEVDFTKFKPTEIAVMPSARRGNQGPNLQITGRFESGEVGKVATRPAGFALSVGAPTNPSDPNSHVYFESDSYISSCEQQAFVDVTLGWAKAASNPSPEQQFFIDRFGQ